MQPISEFPFYPQNSRTVDIVNVNFFDWDGNTIYKGGAERYIYDLASLLKQKGWFPRILQNANRPFSIEYRGIPVIGVETRGRYNWRNLSATYAEVCKNADLVIASPLELACRLSGLNVIGINHGIHWDYEYNNFQSYRIQDYQDIFDGLEVARSVVAVDTNFINWVRTYNYSVSRKIVYIPNYFDSTKFYPVEKNFDGQIRVLYPRRLYAPRGIFLVLKAFEYLLSAYRFLELHLVGQAEPDVVPIVMDFIRRFPNQVVWEELDMDEMHQAYNKSHIVIIPTLWAEGTSLSCIEAMATNNAVIATNVGGLPNLVINGYNGLLISPTSQNLRDAIEHLLNHRSLLSRLAAKGIEVANAFEKEKWEERWMKVIHSTTDELTVRKGLDMTKRILIAGAGTHSWWNAGDEAIFSVMVQTFRSKFPHVEIGVVSANPTGVLADTYQVRELPFSDVQQLLEFARESDLLILGGGGLFYDYWGFSVENLLSRSHVGAGVYTGFALLASLLNKPLMIYAVGVGPLYSAIGKHYTYLTFEQAQSITVRDSRSKKLLIEIGIAPEKVQVTADPVWMFPDVSDEFGKSYLQKLGWGASIPIVGVAVRPWTNPSGEEWETSVAQALDDLIERHHLKVLFIPFHKDNGLVNDYAESEKVRSLMKYRDETHVVDANLSLINKISMLRCCSLVLGMRLHANILAMRHGIPAVGLAYDPKVSALFEDIGQPQLSIDLRLATSYSLLSVLDQVYQNRDSLVQNCIKLSATMLSRAQRNLEVAISNLGMKQSVTSLSLPATSVEWIKNTLLEKISALYKTEQQIDQLNKAEQQIAQLQVENAQLNSQNAFLQTQFNEITGSLAWKVAYRLSRFRYALAPSGSKREIIFRMMVDGVRLFKREGLLAFIRAVIRKMKSLFRSLYRRFRFPPDLSPEQFYERVLAHREKYKGVFVQHVTIDWDIPLYQRPQHLASALGRLGYLVIYKTGALFNNGYREVSKNVWLTNASLPPLPNAVYSIYSTDLQAAKSEKVIEYQSHGSIVVYEYIDHIDAAISGQENVSSLQAFKDFAFRKADFVVVSSRALEEDALQVVERDRVLYIPNGVDVSHYRNPPRVKVLPKSLLDFRHEFDSVIGYFGAIAPWLWYDMLSELLPMRPDLGFVFIGPDYYGGVSCLPKEKNLLYLGPVKYQDLPAYARLFDVCFIPFAPGKIARTTSPLKLFEYFALEKPVVVTSFMDECTAFDEVFSGDSAVSLSKAIDAALAVKDNQEYKNRLSFLADKNSWDERAKEYEKVFSRFLVRTHQR
ncbi:MAG TPA: glycosyltransferase [Anaerolineales bacterium]|nr:glycosyltransferase [Anaerolineales bacterium]